MTLIISHVFEVQMRRGLEDAALTRVIEGRRVLLRATSTDEGFFTVIDDPSRAHAEDSDVTLQGSLVARLSIYTLESE